MTESQNIQIVAIIAIIAIAGMVILNFYAINGAKADKVKLSYINAQGDEILPSGNESNIVGEVKRKPPVEY